MALITVNKFREVCNTVVGYRSGSNVNYRDCYTVQVLQDSKSYPTSSDHKRPTEYKRLIGEIVNDEPVRFLNIDHTGVVVDSRHYSVSRPNPAYWGKPSGFQTLVDNEAARVMTTVRGNLRKPDTFEIGVSVAEAKATAEMLGDTGVKIGTAVKNFRRYLGTLPRNKRQAALALAGAWLQGYYGWGSLARDAFDLDSKLRSKMDEPQLITATAAATVQWSGGDSNWHTITTWRAKEVLRAKILARIETGFLRDQDSWGLANPATIAWEVAPFSFVIDWIIPIGNTLQSLSATAGLQFEYGYSSATYDGYNDEKRAPFWDIVDQGHYAVRNKSFSRSVMGNFPLPELYANANPFSTNRIINGAALITQAVLG